MDKDFFVEELQTHHAMLYRVAYTILQNDDACCDALQDAALKAWEKRHTLRETRYFRTWVTRILINACYDTRRQAPGASLSWRKSRNSLCRQRTPRWPWRLSNFPSACACLWCCTMPRA